jgi:hypothetical protein
VIRQLHSPHLLDAYTRAPHPQAGDHRGESSTSDAAQVFVQKAEGALMSVTELAGLGVVCPAGMESRCDIGLQQLDLQPVRDSYRSDMTAVSVAIPEVRSPVQVWNG